MLRPDGLIHIDLDESILMSDEAILIAIGHEMYELNRLREEFATAPNGVMSFSYFRTLVDANTGGKLHLAALRDGNRWINEMRKTK